MKKLLSVLLAFALLVTLVACGSKTADTFVKPDNYATVLSLTINPEFNLYLDESGKVLAVEPLNDDAKAIVDKLDIKNTNYDTAIGTIVKVADENGYVKEDAKIEVAVLEVKDASAKATFLEKATAAIESTAKKIGKTLTVNEDTASKEAASETAVSSEAASKATASKETASAVTSSKATASKATASKATASTATPSKATSSAPVVVTQDKYTYFTRIVRADKSGDLKGYSICVTINTKGGTFWNSNDEQQTITTPCMEIWNLNGGYYVIPQDYSKCSTRIQQLGNGYMDSFDAGMYGLPNNLTWNDLFTDQYFKTAGGLEYNGVRYMTMAGGFGGGSPLFGYTESNGAFTLTSNLTGINMDFELLNIKWSADRKTLNATVRFDGKDDAVVLDLR